MKARRSSPEGPVTRRG